MSKFNVLILGASYGSLFATKLALAGHDATMVCLPEEVDLINREGTIVRLPIKNSRLQAEINSNEAPGKVSALTADNAMPSDYDLIVFAMQEPQYRIENIRQLLKSIGESGKPCLSIMNMPPPPYLMRLAAIDLAVIENCYTDMSVWSTIRPEKMTLASPDPQAFRPPEEALNVLQVALPTNFKVAAFHDEADTRILRDIQKDIEGIRYRLNGEEYELPVKLKVHDSIFVPLAKWQMLVTGNYRCIQDQGVVSIQEAVHADLQLSEDIYNSVGDLCRKLGASAEDLVPFEKYAAAAQGLSNPSSAARALLAGATFIERLDKLVLQISMQAGIAIPGLPEGVQRVDDWLAKNRAAAEVA